MPRHTERVRDGAGRILRKVPRGGKPIQIFAERNVGRHRIEAEGIEVLVDHALRVPLQKFDPIKPVAEFRGKGGTGMASDSSCSAMDVISEWRDVGTTLMPQRAFSSSTSGEHSAQNHSDQRMPLISSRRPQQRHNATA